MEHSDQAVVAPETDDEAITTLVGREVYSNSGVYVGEVEDIRLDLGARAVTGLALTEVNQELLSEQLRENHGVVVPYRWVRSVGDIVLVSDVVERIGVDDPEDDLS